MVVSRTALERFAAYVHDGGGIMVPLVIATVVLWLALGWRVMALRRGSGQTIRQLVARFDTPTGAEAQTRGVVDEAARRAVLIARSVPHTGPIAVLRGRLDEVFGGLEDDMARFGVLARSIVMVAPLTGLLGTVTGMIETFDSLASMSLFSQSGGIAGGISQALITTQMGLAIAIPGLILGRMLDRRHLLLLEELEELKTYMCARHAEQGADTQEVS